MKDINNYWVDENNNSWDSEMHTEEEAEAYSNSLVYCTNCTNCIDCSDCSDCSDCVACTNCINCRDCENCSYCRYCINCTYCIDGINYIDCIGLYRLQKSQVEKKASVNAMEIKYKITTQDKQLYLHKSSNMFTTDNRQAREYINLGNAEKWIEARKVDNEYNNRFKGLKLDILVESEEEND